MVVNQKKTSGFVGTGLYIQDNVSPPASGLYVDGSFLQTVWISHSLLVRGQVFSEEIHRTSLSISPCMKRGNKETVGSKDRFACSVNQLIMADNSDNTRWELSTLHCLHSAQDVDLDLSFEHLNSAVCAVFYQCSLHYKLLISHRTAKESVLFLIFDKQELRSLFY